MEKNEPIHEIKLGRIRAAIWENQTEGKDEVWYNVVPSRLYKDGAKWKDTTSFRRDDLPIVAKALDMAYGWLWRRQIQQEQSARRAA